MKIVFNQKFANQVAAHADADNEKSYTHNFLEDINFALSKADENIKRDSKISFEDKLQVPSTNDEIDSEDTGIYDEKTITEISCPDKVVISEHIIKDVCIDEGVKGSPNKVEENEKSSPDITEEGEEIAIKTVQDQSLVPDEKEVVIGEVSDEKMTSLKDLFFSEDQKSANLDSKNQTTKKHSQEANMAIGSNTGQPFKSSRTDVSFEEVTDDQPVSLSVLSGTEMSGTEEMLDASRPVPPCQPPVERHTEEENGCNDGPKLTARMSFSKNCGESSVEELEQRGNNSACIAYSGSISIRSDSSTTSARSFAFPILQSEWNSSPVKMAKADRRRYRKYRGWRSSLWCCGF